MARRKKAVTGLTSELKAQLRLAEDPNLIVFYASWWFGSSRYCYFKYDNRRV